MTDSPEELTIIEETTLEVAGVTLRISTLSNGERAVDAEDMEELPCEADGLPSTAIMKIICDALASRH